MEHYTIVGKLKLEVVEGAKTLQMAFYNGLPFAVSKDMTEDKLYLIFLPDGQLSEEYAKYNDCIQYKDADGNVKGGFFGKNRKVRAINLMKGKIRSVGYIADLESLEYTGYNLKKIKEGDTFSELNGVAISNKFINEATRNRQGKRAVNTRREVLGMRMHPDTDQWYKNQDELVPGCIMTVTEKLDGTSVRVSEAYEDIKFNWFMKLINRFIPIQDKRKAFLCGTRRVLLNEDGVKGYYDNHNDLYKGAVEPLRDKLHLGESIYGEIVGWQSSEKVLFDRGGVKFTYGLDPGIRAFYVYGIKWTLPDGTDIQLPWFMVKARCKELDIKHVPEIYIHNIPKENSDELITWLIDTYLPSMVVGQSALDNRHIKEGLVIRLDKGMQTNFYKYKSDEYYMLEDKFKNDEKNVDIEEIA